MNREQRNQHAAEYRRNPFTGEWVIVATGRDARPYEFPARLWRRAGGACPFCHEHESATPPAVAQWSLPRSDYSWDVRVVRNKFPAVCPLPREYASTTAVADPSSWKDARPVFGTHEVIVESPDHRVDWSEFSIEHLALVFQAYRQRLRIAAEAERLQYGLIFKNVGPDAGASIEHAHSQLIALDQIPAQILAREERCADHYRQTGRCLTCEWMEWEVEQGCRIVQVDEHFATLCPWFSRVAGEFWIVPRHHRCHFMHATNDELASLASHVLAAAQAIQSDLQPCYNVVLQTAPLAETQSEASHWAMQVLPRRVAVAGFEWATGTTINTASPEVSAEAMRAAQRERSRVSALT